MYTWGCGKWADDLESSKQGSSCRFFVAPSVRGNGSLSSRKRTSQRRTDGIRLNRRISIPSEKVIFVNCICAICTKVVSTESLSGASFSPLLFLNHLVFNCAECC